MSESDVSQIEEEVLVLQSIYGEEDIFVDYGSDTVTIEMTLHPSTANDVDSQYVYVNLQFQVGNQYPEVIPAIIIKSSRGLSDETVSQLLSNMNTFAEDRLGEMVLFDLIEMVKEILTNNNMPWHPCSICLCHFHKCDVIFKTECYHYFHGFCMRQYIDHENSQIEKPNHHAVFACPVCRNEITVNVSSLENAAKPFNDVEVDTDADLSSYGYHKDWKKHAEIYKRQKMNGGIIDLEHEKNKNLLSNLEKAFAAAAIEKQDQEAEADPEHEVETPSTSQHNHEKRQTSQTNPSQRHIPNSRRGGYNRGRARGYRGSYNNRGNSHHRDRRPNEKTPHEHHKEREHRGSYNNRGNSHYRDRRLRPNNDTTLHPHGHQKEKELHKHYKPFNRKRGNGIPHRTNSNYDLCKNVTKQQHSNKEVTLKSKE